MTKIAKNQKMPRSGSDEQPEDTAGDGTADATKPTPMFKPRPHADEHVDPLDLGEDLEDFGQEVLHPSSTDQGEKVAINPWVWDHPDGLTVEDVHRQDRAIDTVEMGKPRTVYLSTGPVTYLRLIDRLTEDDIKESATASSAEHRERLRLKLDADFPVELAGPATEHAIDEAVSALFTRAPTFAPFLQALRESTHLSLARGANYFHFRPMLVASPPGIGKSTVVRMLADAAGLPLIHLDGSTMMTTVALTGGDAVFRTSRPADLVKGVLQHGIGNPIVAFDELDKLADVSHGAREQPAEALLPFLEPGTAGRVREHFLQIDLDLRFLNWVLLANDLEKVPRTVRDRCKVIQIPPLTPNDLAAVAEAEVLRRHLEPELVAVLTRACARGQIRSLRKLNKTLDAAQATLRRSSLH